MVSDCIDNTGKKNVLPDWFDLAEYSEITQLKLSKLLDLIDDRVYLLRDNAETIRLFNRPLVDEEQMLREISENGLLAWHQVDRTDYIKNLVNDDPNIFPEHIVNPLIFSDIEYLFVNMKSANVDLHVDTDVKDGDITFPIRFDAHLSGQMLSEYTSDLYCSLAFEHFTDDEILAELKRLLPLLRARFGIVEPKQNSQKRIGISTVKNILNYRVLAFLDLKVWSMVSNCQFTNEFLARVLFPEPLENGDFVSGKNIAETRGPFVENFILNDNFIRKMRIWAKTELTDGKIPFQMTISEVIAW